MLGRTSLLSAVGFTGRSARAAVEQAGGGTASSDEPFRYCFNTSTIRGQQLPLVQEIEIAAKAGYQGVELWTREIHQYVEEGGKLRDLKQRIADLGLAVENAIGFPQWIVDDDRQRKEGFESMKRDMEVVREVGGRRIAAPPAGAATQPDLNLFKAARRYRELLELGRRMDVTPQLELWGASKSLSRLGELVFVAVESGHPDACLLPDVYHIYKGGSDFEGLRLIDGGAIRVLHLNDYPADPPREKATDADRVYPGDGVAPLRKIIRSLHETGFRGALSLELFNRDYWRRDAMSVARIGLEKMRSAVRTALA